MNGCRPIVEYMTFNFCMVGIDQIINNAAKMRQMSGGQFNIPIVFRDNSFCWTIREQLTLKLSRIGLQILQGLKVVVPSNVYDAKGLLKSAIRDNDPVIFMESEQMYGDKGEVPDGEYTIPLGVADVVREGTDVTIVSFGKIIKEAFLSKEMIWQKGISCEVIDLRTVRPMDTEAILKSVKKNKSFGNFRRSLAFASVSSEITYLVQEQALISWMHQFRESQLQIHQHLILLFY